MLEFDVEPTAPRHGHVTIHHGIRLDDPYHWLRAANWQEVMRNPKALDPEIRTYLEAENARTKAALAHTADLQAELYRELRGRIKEDDSGVPVPDGPFAYFFRYEEGAEHPAYCREPRDGGPVEVLVDGQALGARHVYFRFGTVVHSPDHRRVAYATDDTGGEYFTIRVRDLATGADLEDVIPSTAGDLAWAADGETLFYVWIDDRHRPRRVYAHRLGTAIAEDVLLYEEKDVGFFVGLGTTQSRRYIIIKCNDHQTSEIRLIDAHAPSAPPVLIEPRQVGHEYSVDHHEDQLVILTNADGAEDFKIMAAPVAAPQRRNWREIVPHQLGRFILASRCFERHLVRLERENGLPRIVIRDWATAVEHDIRFDEEAYALRLGDTLEYETTILRFTYSSMTTPNQTFDYDMAARQRDLRKTQEVPSGHDPRRYVTRRLMAPAPDGELVPVSVVHARDLPLDGTAPCLLHGYGAYGLTMPAIFDTNRLSLVDRGFVYAIAHVRGGKDKGYGWYRAGKHLNKMNTFSDFIAVAEHLASEGYTSRGNIIAMGGSAGGMLAGAVANMAPKLFRGIIAQVPFVDVLNTMLDADLPLTPPEWPEWGNPIASEEDFRYILSYSPYENVRAQDYPHIFALAGLTDPRVTYWEPAKWVARLRANRTNNNLLLLRTHMEAGHVGAAGRFDHLKEVALIYAFACSITARASSRPSGERYEPSPA
ncbi:S9 family peptidase [Rhodoligotrophos defluvii]|uniref:S9 family peptidase n=1 Tax=Rhodoligotrophos defluvii TaxID=2561934 RepID=UPI0010C94F2C|nr:S9 family peptidase [Rhodoligotrophos defluvii]